MAENGAQNPLSTQDTKFVRRPVAILGVPVDSFRMNEVLDLIDEFIKVGGIHQIATANTDFLLKSHQDPELRRILRRCDLVVADGMPLVLASKWLRCPIPERVTGADLVPMLAERAAQKGYRIFMLGARQEVADRARVVLETNNPGIQIVGQYSPPPADISKMDNQNILTQIEASKPDILLVAFGNPKQEKWISMLRDALTVPVCIGIGGTFDFIAGEIPRAPKWVQTIGMEWFYRFLQEPNRMFSRYYNDIVFFGRHIQKQIDLMKVRPVIDECSVVTKVMSGKSAIIASGNFELAASNLLGDELYRVVGESDDIILSMADVEYIDSSALGSILITAAKCRRLNKQFVITGAKRQPLWSMEFAGVLEDAEIARTLTDGLAGRLVKAKE